MRREQPSPSSVALTFDDGPDPRWTPLVLDALADADAAATFFVVAPLAGRHPSLLARMRDAGHEVAFHCTRHIRHDRLTPEEIEADARAGLPTLESLGQPVRYWRTPWGLVTAATEEVARTLRLGLVGWTADTEDWRAGAAKELLALVEHGVVPGAIVLMHDGVGPGAERTGCEETVGLVAPLVALARSRGLEPVPVGDLGHRLPDRNPDFVAPGSEAVRTSGV